MIIAIVNETSAGDRNADLMAALDGRGHRLINAGMERGGETPELTYIHTGLMAGLLLASGQVDLVVGGCGTGLGFMLSANQYPGVFCGLVATAPEAWLFAQINGGNCISLPLNYGYGWAADVNLRFIFDRYFSVESGIGYPSHRKESQRHSRETLAAVNTAVHRSWVEVVATLDDEVILPVLRYPRFVDRLSELLDAAPGAHELMSAIEARQTKR